MGALTSGGGEIRKYRPFTRTNYYLYFQFLVSSISNCWYLVFATYSNIGALTSEWWW